jgi:hypothetical protein
MIWGGLPGLGEALEAKLKIMARWLSFLILAGGMAMAQSDKQEIRFPNAAELHKLAARFAPAPLRVETAHLSAGDRKALARLIEAGRILDEIFLEQYWSGNQALRRKLQADRTPLGQARMRYFWINKSPWGALDDFRAFLPGVPPRKLEGANFYPEDMTKEEFEAWVKILPPAEQEQANGFFTVIQRGPDRKLRAVPYSEVYKQPLTRAAKLLREAAALTGNASLRKFLSSRADALLSNDYYESDLAWMDLDAPLDITFGPYETYNDDVLGYKAAFEAYIGVRDERESAKLAALTAHLQEVEDHLPIDPKYRTPKLGAAAPIRVLDQVLASGDGAHGVTTAAYNLPNDDRVVQQKGSKRVMLKNVQEAKFHSVLIPISGRMLAKKAVADVKFEPFFTHILAHELMHGLGPHQIRVQGRDTSPREEIKELYGAIEEAKADVTGLFALQYLMDNAGKLGLEKLLPSGAAAERQLYTTYLASSFRSLRFGLNDAHGKGMAVQFNTLVDKGGFVAQPDGTYSVNYARIKMAVEELDHDLLTIEAEGDYARAKKLLEGMGVMRPEVQKALDRLEGIPTDIDPIFVTAEELAPSSAGTAKKAGRQGKKS